MSDPGEPLVRVRSRPQAEVLEVRVDELATSEVIERLGRDLRRAVSTDAAKHFVLDLGGVKYLSSAALGAILNVRSHLENRASDLVIAARGEVARVLSHTRLDRLIPVYEDTDSALEALPDT